MPQPVLEKRKMMISECIFVFQCVFTMFIWSQYTYGLGVYIWSHSTHMISLCTYVHSAHMFSQCTYDLTVYICSQCTYILTECTYALEVFIHFWKKAVTRISGYLKCWSCYSCQAYNKWSGHYFPLTLLLSRAFGELNL